MFVGTNKQEHKTTVLEIQAAVGIARSIFA
jgi:hypothetical protein